MIEGLRPRLKLLMAMLGGLGIVFVAQLVHVQIVNHEFWDEWAVEQQSRRAEAPAPARGTIRDRDGNILAGNSVEYAVEAAPILVLNDASVASDLASILHLPAGHIKRSLELEDPWVSIASPVSKSVGEAVAELEHVGIYVRPLWRRSYPEGSLAAHLLGFCNEEGLGYYGIEDFYNSDLRPTTATRASLVQAVSRHKWFMPPVVRPLPGADLHLTLDRDIQALTERVLAEGLEEFEAESGTIIVMDPATFAILAVASSPSYDPERYRDYAQMEHAPYEDPAVSKQYEPGSVFKVLTVAAAIDAGLVSPNTVYHDTGRIEVGGRVMMNATRKAYGDQTVTGLLVKSLNVGAAWLSTSLGPNDFYRYLQAFGIGRRTGVDLASEVSGQLWLPGDMVHYHDSNLGTNSFGQGLAVTPMQMIAAIATVANGGTRLRPHIADRLVAFDGTAQYYSPVVEAQVISPETARLVTDMMVTVVEEGAKKAQVPGYRIAGKTGTAEIPIPGGYDPDGTIASFVGFGPVPDPRFVILVILNRPQTSPWGSQTATVCFQRLASQLFVLMGVPPQLDQLAEAQP